MHTDSTAKTTVSKRRQRAARVVGALTRRAGVIALGTTIVVSLFGGTLAYRHLIQKARYDALSQLSAHARQHAEREAFAFESAAGHLLAVRSELAQRIANDLSDDTAFASVAETHPDGATRRRPGPDRTGASIFVPRGIPMDAEFKHRLVSAHKVASAHGASRTHGQVNTYVMLPESATVMHWPDRPDWDKRPPADPEARREPQWSRAITGNPLGAPVWTAPFYDRHAGARLIACVAPLTAGGRVIAVTGMDLPLDAIVARVMNDAIDGATHMIVRHDGTLIAHPDFAQVAAQQETPPPNPKRDALLSELPKPGQMLSAGFTKDGNAVLVAAEIPGAGARYVSSLPTSKLTGTAAREALIFTAVLSMVIGAQGWIIYVLMRRRVLNRIERLTRYVQETMSEEMAAPADARLDSILNTIPGIVFTCRMDADWRIIYISGHVERMTGFPVGDFIDGICSFQSITHPEDGARVAAEIRQKADLAKGYVVEYRIIARDGRIIHVREEARFGVDPKTGETVIDGIIHDIEDIHLRERAVAAPEGKKNGPDAASSPSDQA